MGEEKEPIAFADLNSEAYTPLPRDIQIKLYHLRQLVNGKEGTGYVSE